VTTEVTTPNSGPVTACDHQKQLDHLDDMCHRILQLMDQLEPLLPHVPRMAKLLAVRNPFAGKDKAGG
jgi:hypothetical protein